MSRRPQPLPVDYEMRLKTTLRALRFVRVNQQQPTEFFLLDREQVDLQMAEEQRREEHTLGTSRPIDADAFALRPSFAALQLYITSDAYVARPIVFTAADVVDRDVSNESVTQFVRSLLNAMVEVGDVKDEKGVLLSATRVSEFESRFPLLYQTLRLVALQRHMALNPVQWNHENVDLALRNWTDVDDEVAIQRLRLANRVERELLDTRGALLSGNQLTRDEAKRRLQSVVRTVAVDVLQSFYAAMPSAVMLRAVKQEQLGGRRV